MTGWVCPVLATPAYNLSLKCSSVSPTLHNTCSRHLFCFLEQNLLRQPAGPRVQLQYNLTIVAHSQHPIGRQPSSSIAFNPLPLQYTIVSAVTFLLVMGYLASPLLNIFTYMSSRFNWLLHPSSCCLSWLGVTRSPSALSSLSTCYISWGLILAWRYLACLAMLATVAVSEEC